VAAINRSVGSGERFIVHRPVIYSGNDEEGFFENPEVQSLLEGVEDVAALPSVPHVTVTSPSFGRRVMAEHPDMSLLAILSECRKVADGMPDRQSGLVKSVRLLGGKDRPYVVLNPRNALKKSIRDEFEEMHAHFGIPFDLKHFFPHVSLIKVFDPEKAVHLRDRLNDVISGYDRSMHVALGGLTAIRGVRD
jgi:hypothetical protein